MSKYIDAFDAAMGDCTRIDMTTITEEDVRAQCQVWINSGEADDTEDTEKWIQDCIRGLQEYQE